MNVTFPPEEIRKIEVDWIDVLPARAYALAPLPDSILVNHESKCIRFKLRTDQGTADEMEYEVVLAQDSKGLFLKADCWDAPGIRSPVTCVPLEDCLLFLSIDEVARVYIIIS